MTRVRFDDNYDPPAPVLPVRVGGIDPTSPTALLRMLVDTGADCSLIPARLARSLRLPYVDKIEVQGVGGNVRSARVYAARIRLGPLRLVTRMAAFGDEALLGRDLLNRLSLHIDGRAGTISIAPATKRTRK